MQQWRPKRGGNSNSNSKSNFNSSLGRYGSKQKPLGRRNFKYDNWEPEPTPDVSDIPAWVEELPPWEKDFIVLVGNMTLDRFGYCHGGINLHKDVLNWDDSAGCEAFHNAKSRFSEMWEYQSSRCEGFYKSRCEWWEEKSILNPYMWFRELVPEYKSFRVPLPDPYMYIDDLDDNAKMDPDPELLVDLEKALEPVELPPEPIRSVIIDGVLYCDGKPFEGTGWECVDPVPDPLSSLMKLITSPECGNGNEDPSKPGHGLSPNTTLLDATKKASSISNSWEDHPGDLEKVQSAGPRNIMENTTRNSWGDNGGGWEELPSIERNVMNNTPRNSWGDNGGGWKQLPSIQRNVMNNTPRNSWGGNGGGWEQLPSIHKNMMENPPRNSWEDNGGDWIEAPSRSIRKNTRSNSCWDKNAGGQSVPLSRWNTTKAYQDQNYSRNTRNWNRNEIWRKKESKDQHPPGYQATGYQQGIHQTIRGSTDNKGKKRVTFAQELTHVEPLAPRHWNSINP